MRSSGRIHRSDFRRRRYPICRNSMKMKESNHYASAPASKDFTQDDQKYVVNHYKVTVHWMRSRFTFEEVELNSEG